MAESLDGVHYGGYTNEFVDPPPEDLCCRICAFPYREPLLLGCCGRKICEPCIERERQARKPCPFCTEKRIQTLLDRELQGKVLDLKVYCLNRSVGCTWERELRDLQDHIKKHCVFVEEECRYSCGERFPRHRLVAHERDECPRRPTEVKMKSFVRKMEASMDQLEGRVVLKETAMKAQISHLERSLQEQKETYELKIATLTEQLHTLQSQLFCPPCRLTMPAYEQRKRDNDWWYSPPFYTRPGGYKMCLRVDVNGSGSGAATHVSVFVHLMRGEHDDDLKWPFRGIVTIQLVNQKSEHHCEHPTAFNGEGVASERVVGRELGGGWGCSQFISHTTVRTSSSKTQYIHNDCLTFRIPRIVVN